MAAALFDAIEAGDIEAVRSLYAPDVVVWHNTDGKEQGADENLRTLAWCVRHIRGMRYEDVRCFETPSGFVEQHTLRGTTGSGAELAVPACLVVSVRDGLIARIDEYLDSAQLAGLV